MKSLGYAASLLLLTVGVTILPPAAGAAPAPSRTPAQELRGDARGTVSVTREPATGQLGFVRTGPQGDLLGEVEAVPVAKADEYLDRHGDAFGAPAEQLVRESVETDEVGTTVTYTQEYRGVPVWGAMLKANLSPDGDLRSVNGAVVPDLDLSVVPALDAAEAGRRAVALVRAEPPGDDPEATEGLDSLEAGATELVVYREGLVQGETGESSLAYTVEVTNGDNIAEMVILTATKGAPLNRYSLSPTALRRVLSDGNSITDASTVVWDEAQGPRPDNLTPDQQRVVDATSDTYWLFRNTFRRASYDGNDAAMSAVIDNAEICKPPSANAMWKAQKTWFCPGTTSDDIVAHEWTHAYTEYTHNLIYQWQPGALNESFSDIFGEVVDLVNGRDDEDEGLATTTRPDGTCATPGKVGLTVRVAGLDDRDCIVGTASFGPPLDSPGVDGELVEALGTPAEGAEPGKDGCVAPLVNAEAVAGQIALVEEADDGACAPVDQARNAQEAGALALVIGSDDESVDITPAEDATVTIPVVKITEADYAYVEDHLGDETPVSATLADTRTHRWLVGEKSPGLGGTVRDMWNPNCVEQPQTGEGQPGRVSDAEYHCAATDDGGVHINSGVPNRGFALLVDGGTVDGTTVEGIGLTRAAHIYYRAMTAYQTPTDGFADHADALGQACASLFNAGSPEPLTALSTAPADSAPSSPPTVVRAEDCDQITKMVTALQLRQAAARCPRTPQFVPGTPSECAAKQVRWQADATEGAWGWNVATDLPGGRAGTAFYAEAKNIGNCETTPSQAKLSELTSQSITLPANQPGNARLSFDHYVATERFYDGGNVKVRVRSAAAGWRPWGAVPDSAYLRNPPNVTLIDGPLVGQRGFSGTDRGGVDGSWVQSHIDLSKVGAQPGDMVQVRFDFYRDACDGRDGWYVDDLTLSICRNAVDLTTRGTTSMTYGRQPVLTSTVTGDGGDAAGTVEVLTSGNRLLSAAPLVGGEASLPLPALLAPKPRPYALTVAYAGSPRYDAVREPYSLRVLKAPSKLALTLKPRRPRAGAPIRSRVRVTAVGFKPTGRVVLRAKGRIVGRTTVRDGRVSVVRLTRALPPGRHQVVARYAGNGTTKPVTDRVVVRVRR